jgi:hypothetical protein
MKIHRRDGNTIWDHFNRELALIIKLRLEGCYKGTPFNGEWYAY